MTEALSNALASHRHLRGERVLLQDDGEILTPKIVRNWMISAQRRAGLDPKGAVHILRHTFCSHLAMRGAPAKAIQELAGHQNLQTTLRYMHLSPAAREGAIRLLDRGRDEGHSVRGTAPNSDPKFGDILETPHKRPQN